VIIVDDLSNTSLKVLDGIDAITGKIPAFEKLDLRDGISAGFFKRHNDISGVIHLQLLKRWAKASNPCCIMKIISMPWSILGLQKMTG
jgi:UDP-glucose 4-epimerase